MAFDTNRGMAVLVGAAGVTAPNLYGQSVWEWDGSDWNERTQSGQVPALNDGSNGFVYDTYRQECVLYGNEYGIVDGSAVSSLFPYPDDYRFIWRWNGLAWQAGPPTPTRGVASHFRHSMAFDSARNTMVVFGGLQNGNLPDTNYTYEIVYQEEPVVLKQPTIQVSQLGRQVQLAVFAAGAPPIGYQWQKQGMNLTDGGRTTGADTGTLTLAPAIAADSGRYQVVLSNLCGMAVSRPIQLIVTADPEALAIAVSGSNRVIAWTDSSAMLQIAPSVTGPWTTITGVANPYRVSPNMPARSLRLLRP